MRESAFAHLYRFRHLRIRWETGDDIHETFLASERGTHLPATLAQQVRALDPATDVRGPWLWWRRGMEN